MEKIRILGIAPYEGICLLLREAASKIEGVDLEAYTGNLDAGREIALQYADKFDCIISRGGTANLIRQVTSKPVVEIEFSAYDVLQSINLAKSYSEKWAIVGFEQITKNAKLLSGLLRYDIDIYTLNSQSETDSILDDLCRQGYQTVVCDTITDISAKRHGIDSILIHSGPESVASAIEEAVSICSVASQMKKQKEFFEMLLSNLGLDCLVFDGQGSCVYSVLSSTLPPEVTSLVQHQVSLSPAARSQSIQKNIKGSIYTVEVRNTEFDGNSYLVFTVSCQRNKTARKATGIQYYTAKELNDTFLRNFYISSNPELVKYEHLDSAGAAPPLMILGAPGTGKSQCAAYLHVKSPNWNNTFVDCDFSLMSERELQYLFSSVNSPVWSNGVTFYLHNLDAVSEERFVSLLSLLAESDLCSRNRVIFSWVRKKNEEIPERARSIMDQLSCYTLHLPTLQERIRELPQLAIKYVNAFNSVMPKQVIGFQPEALTLMEEYSWPGNLLQLKRVIFQAMAQADDLYISTATIDAILDNERIHLIPEAKLSLDLSGTMQEIKREVVKIVLAQCGNNQSKAAQRLGIGRTTLWRLLGND